MPCPERSLHGLTKLPPSEAGAALATDILSHQQLRSVEMKMSSNHGIKTHYMHIASRDLPFFSDSNNIYLSVQSIIREIFVKDKYSKYTHR